MIKNKSRFFPTLIALFFGGITAQASLYMPEERLRDVITRPCFLFVDDEADETLLGSLLLAMAQHVDAPVIVSHYLLCKALQYAYMTDVVKVRENYPNARLSMLGTTRFATEFFQAKGPRKRETQYDARFKAFASVWKIADWNYYGIQADALKSPFFLLLPRAMANEEHLGLDLEALVAYDPKNLFEKLVAPSGQGGRVSDCRAKGSGSVRFTPEGLYPFFKKRPNLQLPQWIVCWVGHGSATGFKTFGGFDVTTGHPTAAQKLLTFFARDIWVRALYIDSCYAAGDTLKQIYEDRAAVLVRTREPLPFPLILAPVGDVSVVFQATNFDSEEKSKMVSTVHYDAFVREIQEGHFSYLSLVPPLVAGWQSNTQNERVFDDRENYPQIIPAGTSQLAPLFQGTIIDKIAAQYRQDPLRPLCEKYLASQPKQTKNYYIFLKTPYIPFTLDLSGCSTVSVIVPALWNQHFYVFEHLIVVKRKSKNVLDPFMHSEREGLTGRGKPVTFYIKNLEIKEGEKTIALLEYVQVDEAKHALTPIQAKGILGDAYGIFSPTYLTSLDRSKFIRSENHHDFLYENARHNFEKMRELAQRDIDFGSQERKQFVEDMGLLFASSRSKQTTLLAMQELDYAFRLITSAQ